MMSPLPTSLPSLVSCGFYRITPARAGELLAGSARVNRPLRRVHVRRLQDDMKSGRFVLTGDSVVFDSDGNILNGHHRLTASFESGAEFDTLCAFGLPPDVFPVIDTGATRSGGDRLAIMGEKNTSNLAALLRVLWCWSKGRPPVAAGLTRAEYTPREEQAALGLYPQAREAVSRSKVYCCQNKSVRPVEFAFLEVVTRYYCPEKADEFIQGLLVGADLKTGSPILLLRNRLLADEKEKAKLPADERTALLAKAWTAFVEGRSLKYLRWHKDVEKFPSFEPDSVPATAEG